MLVSLFSMEKHLGFLGKEKHFWVLGVFFFLDFSVQLVCEFLHSIFGWYQFKI